MKLHSILLLAVQAIAPTLAARFGPREECHNEASTVGTHANGMVPLAAEEAIATRYLLVKKGTADNGILICGANAEPTGICVDEPASGDKATVAVLGSAPGTQKVRASEAIAAGANVYTAASGKVQDLPAGAGTYYKVGRAITAAAADGDLIEIAPCYPVATVVP